MMLGAQATIIKIETKAESDLRKLGSQAASRRLLFLL